MTYDEGEVARLLTRLDRRIARLQSTLDSLDAQRLIAGLTPPPGVIVRPRDSERVPAPGRTSDARSEGEPCVQLVGADYPPHWCTCEEAAWQQLVDDVETDEQAHAERGPGTESAPSRRSLAG